VREAPGSPSTDEKCGDERKAVSFQQPRLLFPGPKGTPAEPQPSLGTLNVHQRAMERDQLQSETVSSSRAAFLIESADGNQAAGMAGRGCGFACSSGSGAGRQVTRPRSGRVPARSRDLFAAGVSQAAGHQDDPRARRTLRQREGVPPALQRHGRGAGARARRFRAGGSRDGERRQYRDAERRRRGAAAVLRIRPGLRNAHHRLRPDRAGPKTRIFQRRNPRSRR